MWAIFLPLILCGFICFFVFFKFYTGSFRAILIFWNVYSSSVFGLVPLGITFILMGFMTFFPYPNFVGQILMYSMGLFLVVAMFCSIKMPIVMSPWWFRIMRENYPHCDYHVFLFEASQNYSDWLEKTKTPEGMEKWAEEIFRKRFDQL